MDDDAVLTFQARSDARLMRPVLRRLIWPIPASVAVLLLLAALVCELAGNTGLAVSLAVTGVGVALMLQWQLPSMVVERQAAKLGHVIAYRIDGTGIETVAGFAPAFVPWSAVTRVTNLRGQVAVALGRRKIISIPTRDLNPVTRAQLMVLLHSRGRSASRAG
jgi:hypothetical protein